MAGAQRFLQIFSAYISYKMTKKVTYMYNIVTCEGKDVYRKPTHTPLLRSYTAV